MRTDGNGQGTLKAWGQCRDMWTCAPPASSVRNAIVVLAFHVCTLSVPSVLMRTLLGGAALPLLCDSASEGRFLPVLEGAIFLSHIEKGGEGEVEEE